jgi:hypothetical protein
MILLCQGNEGGAEVDDQAQHDETIDAFANEIVYPQPEELKDQHKECEEKGGDKGADECP